jgi:hypothetical protein
MLDIISLETVCIRLYPVLEGHKRPFGTMPHDQLTVRPLIIQKLKL